LKNPNISKTKSLKGDDSRILIIDFGSQYAQLIARRVRELGVYCEVYPFDATSHSIKQFNPKGIILSGGPETVTIKKSPRAPRTIFALGCPILGICYGMQTMATQLGGKVSSSSHREFGNTAIKLLNESALFPKRTTELEVWMSHGDKVTSLPRGFKIIAGNNNCPIAIMADEQRRFYGVQFHPEVTHTKSGKNLFANFVHEICGCRKLWTTNNIIHNIIDNIKKQVGKDKVLLGLSGGVDSSVAAMLLHQALGDQLTCIFVDTGLLRKHEGNQIMDMFSKRFKIKIIRVNANQKFFTALKGVNEPEKKRKIIGKTFIEIFNQEAKKIKDVKWLAQGTIYPDVVESAQTKFGKAHVIKSHHNVGGLPKKIHLSLVEPLRELFKDEVRKIGIKLGLPHDMVSRHPFPGPGLAVRILGEVKPQYVKLLNEADHIFIEELHKNHLYYLVSQAFAVFLPVKSVAVMGDTRKYDYVIALRAVETVDFMTAKWASLPEKFLSKVSNRICNEVKNISRVVYDISSKPPATIEWE
jgi:GMP synthase (glutamine-hydrolysing)